ncbi:hypothetical protein L0B53_16480 [Vibrio sp. SS-MA-C1-2]|uniref:hypothetical protein n=1 Tax=Vibrio sp. SS-MA-C1-2 TaxID=2908646 RepID=UPI001F23CAC0|nr:hypothetical protein [Vibrio sp. SS-MA-C1-2]UJF18588.1 hypothetical protein L0B53_16480 [Vibrio sp. SS-MA-C1-2]
MQNRFFIPLLCCLLLFFVIPSFTQHGLIKHSYAESRDSHHGQILNIQTENKPANNINTSNSPNRSETQYLEYQQISEEISGLSQRNDAFNGLGQNVIRLQLLSKNSQRRKLLLSLIKNHQKRANLLSQQGIEIEKEQRQQSQQQAINEEEIEELTSQINDPALPLTEEERAQLEQQLNQKELKNQEQRIEFQQKSILNSEQLKQQQIHHQSENEKLLSEVKKQIKFINSAKQSLLSYLNTEVKSYTSMELEGKLLALKNIDDGKMFHATLLRDQWQNYLWLKKFDIDSQKQIDTIASDIKQRSELLSALLNYDLRQKQVYKKQIRTSTQSEKGQLEMLLLLTSRKIDNQTALLKYYVALADEMGIETTKFKQQIFESTGNLTEDILDIQVAYSIIKNSLNDLINWLTINGPYFLFKLFIFISIICLGKITSRLFKRLTQRAISSEKINTVTG